MEDIENIDKLSLKDNLEEELTEEIIMKNREELRKRTNEKIAHMRNKRSSKNIKQESQIKALKENPLFQNLDLNNNTDIKKIIDNLASKMTNDSKQKKNIKKQMDKIIDKMKEQNNED